MKESGVSEMTQNQELMDKVEEAAFKEFTGFGRQSVVVEYRGRAWQMIDRDDRFLFVLADGYNGDEPDVVPRASSDGGSGSSSYESALPTSEQIERLLKSKRRFSLAKSDIVRAEVSGIYEDYFTLAGAEIELSLAKGKAGQKVKKRKMRLLGGINQFLLRDFLSGIGGETVFVKKEASLAAHRRLYGEDTGAHSAMMTYLNKKTARVNLLMWVLSVVGYALIAFGAVPGMPFGRQMMGWGALQPLVILITYLRNRRLLCFLGSGRNPNAATVSRKRVGFYPKFAIPMLATVFAALLSGSIVTDFPLFLGVSAGLAVVMLAALIVFSAECRRHFVMIAACVLMFGVYAFPAVNLINAAVPLRSYGTYTAQVERKMVPTPDEDPSEHKEFYVGITLRDGREAELPLAFGEWNYTVIPGETEVTVQEYKGLLGINCAFVSY